MGYEAFEILFLSGAGVLALALVKYFDHRKRKTMELASMKRMLATICK
ncbi:MAG TPA: hypothetical protein VLZ50_05860 [Terracidiphilus sp.]|nr:hypothetical protein [Terracidiphilus sp.]